MPCTSYWYSTDGDILYAGYSLLRLSHLWMSPRQPPHHSHTPDPPLLAVVVALQRRPSKPSGHLQSPLAYQFASAQPGPSQLWDSDGNVTHHSPDFFQSFTSFGVIILTISPASFDFLLDEAPFALSSGEGGKSRMKAKSPNCRTGYSQHHSCMQPLGIVTHLA